MAKSNESTPLSVLGHVVKLDTTLSENIHTLFRPIIPRGTLKLLEISGDGRLWFPLSISLLLSPISVQSPSLYSLSLSLLVGLISDIILVGFLKQLVQRRRPIYNPAMGSTLPVDHWSFPSGHASRVFFLASLFSLHPWTKIGTRDSALALLVLLWVWSLLTAISRVLLGRHFVFDVFVGAFLGVFNALFVFRFLRF